MSPASIAAAVVVGLRAVHVMNRLIDTVGISAPDFFAAKWVPEFFNWVYLMLIHGTKTTKKNDDVSNFMNFI